MSLSNMSLSSMKMSSMSIEYEQGNQVPRWGALDNIDIPARRNKKLLNLALDLSIFQEAALH